MMMCDRKLVQQDGSPTEYALNLIINEEYGKVLALIFKSVTNKSMLGPDIFTNILNYFSMKAF